MATLRRFGAITLTVWLALGLYFITAHHSWSEPRIVTMPAWVPFWPELAPAYLALLSVTWFMPLAIRDETHFRACLWAFICAFLLVVPLWVLMPTTLPRPPLPEGWGSAWYRHIAAIDPPHNVLPCAHGIGPVVAAWFVGLERPGWRWPLAGMLTVSLPSIALVWQHRPIDILLGTIAAAIGIAVGHWLSRPKVPPAQ